MLNSKQNPAEIIKETSALGRLLIKPVDKPLAKEMIVKNHYSHKWNDGGFGVVQFRDIPRRRTRPLPGSGRLRIYEESKG